MRLECAASISDPDRATLIYKLETVKNNAADLILLNYNHTGSTTL